jgi:threonine dehydrogenase-like Zn-dependent dehydrogenase
VFAADRKGNNLKAIVFENRQARFVDDRARPAPAVGESLIRVEIAAVCSTDREILRGYRPDFSGVMGHEFVGVVCAGDNTSLMGKRVVSEINLSCGRCLYCLTGRPRHCNQRRTLGINKKDGSFAEFVTLPTTLLHPVPEGLAPEQAVYTEPLAAALRVTKQVSFEPSVPVAILGDGRLALMISQALAATTTAVLTVFGHHPEKLALFAPYASVSREPQGDFEVVIDATGSATGLAEALRLTRSEGTLVIKSTYAGLTQLDMSEVVVREIRVQGSRCGDFEPALELLRTNRVTLAPIELYPPEDFEMAFDSPAFKAALDFR